MTVLALDISTVVGWCEGPLEGPLHYGTVRLAKTGGTPAEAYAGMIEFLGRRLMAFRPQTIVYEAPIDPRFIKKINKATIRKLQGLPAIVEGVAYKMGVYDIYEVETGDLKYWLHGSRSLKREVVKPMTFRKVTEAGYEPKTEDEADAIALHRFFATTKNAGLGLKC